MAKLIPKSIAKKQPVSLRVRIIKAPFVDSVLLKEVLIERQRALVL